MFGIYYSDTLQFAFRFVVGRLHAVTCFHYRNANSVIAC